MIGFNFIANVIFTIALPVLLEAAVMGSITLRGSTSDVSCLRLFNAFYTLREGVVNTPTFEELRVNAEEASSAILGIDINNDDAWRNLACRMTAAKNTVQLIQALHMNIRQLEHLVSSAEQLYEKLKRELEGYKRTLRNLARWADASGFPDLWPLQASWADTYAVVLKVQEYELTSYVAIGAPSFLSTAEITRALLQADTIENYIERLGSGYIMSDAETFSRLITRSRHLTDPDNVEATIKTIQAYMTFVETLKDLGILDLAKP